MITIHRISTSSTKIPLHLKIASTSYAAIKILPKFIDAALCLKSGSSSHPYDPLRDAWP